MFPGTAVIVKIDWYGKERRVKCKVLETQSKSSEGFENEIKNHDKSSVDDDQIINKSKNKQAISSSTEDEDGNDTNTIIQKKCLKRSTYSTQDINKIANKKKGAKAKNSNNLIELNENIENTNKNLNLATTSNNEEINISGCFRHFTPKQMFEFALKNQFPLFEFEIAKVKTFRTSVINLFTVVSRYDTAPEKSSKLLFSCKGCTWKRSVYWGKFTDLNRHLR